MEDLKEMLSKKSVQFEEEFIKYRKEVLGNKRTKDLRKSIRNFAEVEGWE